MARDKAFKKKCFHDIIIVGLHRLQNDDKHGGIMFIIQDSDCVNLIKMVSLELTLQMRTKRQYHLDDIPMNYFDIEANLVCSFREECCNWPALPQPNKKSKKGSKISCPSHSQSVSLHGRRHRTVEKMIARLSVAGISELRHKN